MFYDIFQRLGLRILEAELQELSVHLLGSVVVLSQILVQFVDQDALSVFELEHA